MSWFGSRLARGPVPALAVFLLAFAARGEAASVPSVQSRSLLSSIRLDGKPDEWTDVSRVADAKSGLAVAFQNDARYLYVLVTVDKGKALESLESTGLTVRARARTSKIARGDLFLKRPVPAEVYILWRESQGAILTEAEKAELRETRLHDVLLAFAVGPTDSIYGPVGRKSEANPAGFGVSADEAGMISELRIPLPPPDLVPGGIGIPPGETARISFEWGGASRKIGSVRGTREIPPSERGENSPSGQTWAQEYLNAFDPLSPPTMGTKKFTMAVDVKLADGTR